MIKTKMIKILLPALLGCLLAACSSSQPVKAPCTYFDRSSCGKTVDINQFAPV